MTQESTKKLRAQGRVIRVQDGVGVAAGVTDESPATAGTIIVNKRSMAACCALPGVKLFYRDKAMMGFCVTGTVFEYRAKVVE